MNNTNNNINIICNIRYNNIKLICNKRYNNMSNNIINIDNKYNIWIIIWNNYNIILNNNK